MIRATDELAPAEVDTLTEESSGAFTFMTPDRVRVAQELTLTTIRIVVWSLAHLTMFLGAWVVLGWSVTGWTPVVVTSGSMAPTLDTGDIILITDEASIGQRDVIVFDRDGELVVHRVFAVESDRYITKGDANPTPDVDPVPFDEVVGSGRLVVPMIGLPLVWAQQGQWLPLIAWAGLAGAGIVATALAVERALRRKDRPANGPPVSLSRIGIQRVRVVIALLILGRHALGEDDPLDVGNPTLWIVLGAVAILAMTNLFASASGRDGEQRRSRAVFELGVDTALIVVLTSIGGSQGFSWVLFALPIIEAAVRFRLVGALLHWMVLALATMATQVWLSSSEPSETALVGLEATLDQLSVLFLFVIPAAYLAEQLVGELSAWHRATDQAIGRSNLLLRVSDVGRDIVRLESGYLDRTVRGVRSLGFDRVDIVGEEVGGAWRVVAGDDDLPAPGSPASTVRPDDLASGGSITASDDDDEAETDALAAHGLSAVLAHVVSDHGGRRLAVRAGVDANERLTAELIEAFRLLAGQATVALQNDQLMAEVHEVHDELERQALHDELTGLPNRAHMLRRLTTAQSEPPYPTVLFLDLDGFKPINDRLGHDSGDVVLRTVAQRIATVAAPSAFVARLGGDEFTVLLTDSDAAGAAAIAHHVIDAISMPIDVGDDVVHVSASVGIAVGGPEIGDSEIIRRADVAMYDAKHTRDAGGERVALYRPALDQAAHRRASLIADIGTAIQQRSVSLVFQPVYDVASRVATMIGAEALVRWTHPKHGVVSPGEVIEIARSAGVARQLNQLIVLGSCEWLSLAHLQTGTDIFVAVNASPAELGSPSLALDVQRAAKNASISPHHLVVEISESIVTPVTKLAAENMAALRALGVRLMLDDFGEGTTSLSYLQELPIDGVKIDRRLVVNASRSRTDRLVLESIVALSGQIGHSVIAEGIENQDHLDAVLAAGCTMVQGYSLMKPVPGPDLIAAMTEERNLRAANPTNGAASHSRTSSASPGLPDETPTPSWHVPLVDPQPMIPVSSSPFASLDDPATGATRPSTHDSFAPPNTTRIPAPAPVAR